MIDKSPKLRETEQPLNENWTRREPSDVKVNKNPVQDVQRGRKNPVIEKKLKPVKIDKGMI
jgi:hypothetical protein